MSNKDEKPLNKPDQPSYDLKRIFDSFIEETISGLDQLIEQDSFPIKLHETQSDVIIEAMLPGYTKDQINIEIINNQINIAVTDHQIIEEKDDNRNYYRKEQSYTQKRRTITLPFTISKKHTTAEYQDDTLTIITNKG